MEYPLEIVLRTAKISNQDVSNWVRNGFVHGEMPTSQKGRKRTFSRLNVYEFAILSELKRAGVPLVHSTAIVRQIIDAFLQKSDDELKSQFLYWNPTTDDLRVNIVGENDRIRMVFMKGRLPSRETIDENWDGPISTNYPTTMVLFAPHALKVMCDEAMEAHEKASKHNA